MQKVRGSNPLSSTGFSGFLFDFRGQAKNLSVLGLLVALVWVVVAEHVVHYGRSAADRRNNHVPVNRLVRHCRSWSTLQRVDQVIANNFDCTGERNSPRWLGGGGGGVWGRGAPCGLSLPFWWGGGGGGGAARRRSPSGADNEGGGASAAGS